MKKDSKGKNSKGKNAVFDLSMDFVKELQGNKQKSSQANSLHVSQEFEPSYPKEELESFTVPDIVSYNQSTLCSEIVDDIHQ